MCYWLLVHGYRAAIVAIDLVMKPVTVDEKHGEYSRAFVIGRPPGHHAGPMG